MDEFRFNQLIDSIDSFSGLDGIEGFTPLEEAIRNLSESDLRVLSRRLIPAMRQELTDTNSTLGPRS